jgi:hypothetical protein
MSCVTLQVVAGAPDIKITAVTPSKTTVTAGETIQVTVSFRNDGTVDGYATWALSFAGAEYARYTTPSPVPKNGGTLTQTVDFKIPPIVGTQRLCAEVVGQSFALLSESALLAQPTDLLTVFGALFPLAVVGGVIAYQSLVKG